MCTDDTRLHYMVNGLEDLPPAARHPHDPPRVLFLSNMLAAKGPARLVEALAVLARRGVRFDATFAGAPGDGLAEFEAAVARHALGSHVRYLGPVAGPAKDALFRDHDVFALPTSNETFGLVLLEAMRAGLAVVSSREGAIPEIVVDGHTGFIVDPYDIAALADGVARLLADRELRDRMGEAGRARFLENYTLERFEARLSGPTLRRASRAHKLLRS